MSLANAMATATTRVSIEQLFRIELPLTQRVLCIVARHISSGTTRLGQASLKMVVHPHAHQSRSVGGVDLRYAAIAADETICIDRHGYLHRIAPHPQADDKRSH